MPGKLANISFVFEIDDANVGKVTHYSFRSEPALFPCGQRLMTIEN